VSPAFTYSAGVQPMALVCEQVLVETDVVVTEWEATSVRHCVNYCLA